MRDFLRRFRRIGLPYHGLVKDSRLILPGGGLKAYNQPNGGHAWVVKNTTKANSRTRTDEEVAWDTARGYRWQDYALLSGQDKIIGSVELGKSDWLYSDPAGTVWRLRVELTPDPPDIEVTVKVVGRFGHFMAGADADATLSRTIGTLTHTVVLPAWWDFDSTADDLATNATFDPEHLDHAPDGAPACLNIHSYIYPEYGLIAWVEIAVTGTGSTDRETFSNGISAALTSHGLGEVYPTWIDNSADAACFLVPKAYIDTLTVDYKASFTETTEEIYPPDLPCDEANIGTIGTYTLQTTYSVGSPPIIDSAVCEDYQQVLHVYADGKQVTYAVKTELIDPSYSISIEENSVQTQDVEWRPATWYCYWGFVLGTEVTISVGLAVETYTYTCRETKTFAVGEETMTLIGERRFSSTQKYAGPASYYGVTDDTLWWTDEDGVEYDTETPIGYAGCEKFSGSIVYQHATNSLWAVRCSHTEVAGPDDYDQVYNLYLVTQGERRELVDTAIDDPMLVSINCSWDPERDLLAWDDTDEVCYV